MYTISEIQKLQLDRDFYESEVDKYCLIKFKTQTFTTSDLENHVRFCVLQTIRAFSENKIDKNTANHILNKIDALQYSEDMLGVDRVVQKLNKEVIGGALHIPFFDLICVKCEDLYDSFK